MELFSNDSFVSLVIFENQCNLGKRATFHVHEARFSHDGTLGAFAVDFVYYCDIGGYNFTTKETLPLRPQEMRGQLRFNSTVPLRADYCYRYADENLGLVYTPSPTAAPTPPTTAPTAEPSPTPAPTFYISFPPKESRAPTDTRAPTSDKSMPTSKGKVASMGWMLILTTAGFFPFPLCLLGAYIFYRYSKTQAYRGVATDEIDISDEPGLLIHFIFLFLFT
jgi:hypothetical protein